MALEYRQTVAEVLQELASDASRGLTSADARARLARFGRNQLAAPPPVPAWRKFLAQFGDVLVILLLIATAISLALWLYERDAAAAVRGDGDQRRRAAERRDGLRPAGASRVGDRGAAARWRRRTRTSIRDGERDERARRRSGAGDILLVEEGDTVAADAR